MSDKTTLLRFIMMTKYDPISKEEHIVNFETMIRQGCIHANWLHPFNLPLTYCPDEQRKKQWLLKSVLDKGE